MAKVTRHFTWHKSLLGDYIMTIAHRRQDGGETEYVKYQDGMLQWHMGPLDWVPIAAVSLNIPSDDLPAYTDVEKDLLSSVLRDLGYTPGNVDDI